MKKSYLFTFAVTLFILLFSFQSNAQITLQLGAGAGYNVPLGDYGGTTVDFYNGTKYGMKSGYSFNGKARVGLLFLNAFGEIGYTNFTGSGESEPGKGNVDISNKIFTLKVGPEYTLDIPLSPITPYFQGFVSLNTFSGDVEFTGVTGVPSGKYDIASATRVGAGAGVGVLFSLGGIKLDANIQYHLMNLVAKEYKITNVTSHTRLDNYTNLNDDKDPLTGTTSDHFISSSRGISALEFKLTAMFGL